MTARNLMTSRATLNKLAERLRGEVGALREEALTIAEEPRDAAGHTSEGERTLGILSAEGRLLEEVEAALRRIDEGTYGLCTTCGCRIPAARLNALPYARECLACAEVREPEPPA